jgi:hypothetical protein
VRRRSTFDPHGDIGESRSSGRQVSPSRIASNAPSEAERRDRAKQPPRETEEERRKRLDAAWDRALGEGRC